MLFRKKETDASAYRLLMNRADERPLLCLVMLFQALSLLLLAFKNEELCYFSLRTAVILPAGTYLGYRLLIARFHIDRILYILTAFLCGLGVILLRAVFTKSTGAEKQLTLMIIVIPVMITGIAVSRHLSGTERRIKIAMLPALGFIGLSLLFPTSSGARSWMRIGSSLQLQPSELIKPVAIVILASGFTRQGKLTAFVPYAGFAAAACALLMLQHDLGAVFLYFVLTVAMFTVGTGRVKVAAGTFILGIVLAGAVVIISRTTDWLTYLTKRIDVFLNPWEDPYDSGNQIVQGLMSVASGGLFGSGLGLSAAARVSVVESDYIFAAAAEEYGMIFALCLIGVYLMILLRGIQTALNARSRFHALIAFGVVCQMATQAALIILGNLKIVPLTGVTLPFVSSGGSSLLGCSLEMGLLMGVSSLNAEDEYDDLMRLSKGRWKEDAA